MKFILLSFLTLLLGPQMQAQAPKAVLTSKPESGSGYHIRVKIDDYNNDTLILGYRLGTKTYVKDTVTQRNPQGEWVFKGDKALEGGIYLVLLKPDNIYFEFLVPNKEDQTRMFIYTKPKDKDLISNLRIEGSEDNRIFLEYLNFVNKQRGLAENFSKEREEAKNRGDETQEKNLSERLELINKEVIDYQKQLVLRYPKHLSAALIQGSQQPEVPQSIQEQGQEPAYRYFKANYFKDFNWGDDRLIRTPLLEEKIEFYLEKLVIQIPDSINEGVDEIMNMAKRGGNHDVYKYVAAHLLNKYAGSKVICMDAVYVHIGSKYYCNPSQKPDWVEEEQLEKICINVQELAPVRCGQPAPPLQLRDIATNKPVNLYSVKAKFTIVYFWDPACGNCTKSSEALIPVYEKYKNKNVSFLGICSKSWNELDQCKDKINDKKLPWINLSDESYPLAVVKKYYDIKMNPYIYLLDEDKKILFKRLEPSQIDEILERQLNPPKEN